MGQKEVAYTDFPIYRQELRDALGFDDDDLAQNRAGRLGGREKETQLRQLRRSVAVTLGSLVVGVAIGCLGILLHFTASIVLQSFLLFGVTAVAVWYFGRYATRLWRDIQDGVVKNVEGFVRQTDAKTVVGKYITYTYYWSVDRGPRFPVRKAWAVLMPARHRI